MDKLRKTYYTDGRLESEEYYVDEILVSRHYYENGNIVGKSYSKLGKLHREDGPASVMYEINGEINEACWYLNGNEYTFENWVVLVNPSDELAVTLKLQYE